MRSKIQIEKAPKAFRTISEVAATLDLEPYVIRFWESQFKQIKPMRRKGGRRYYRPGDIDFLRGLKDLLHRQNLTIKKVKNEILLNGKNSIVGQTEATKKEGSNSKKEGVLINFSHSVKKNIKISAYMNEHKRTQLNLIIKSFSRLREQMLLRVDS